MSTSAIYKINFENIKDPNRCIEVTVLADSNAEAIALSETHVGSEYRFLTVYDTITKGVIETNEFSNDA